MKKQHYSLLYLFEPAAESLVASKEHWGIDMLYILSSIKLAFSMLSSKL